MFMTTFRKMRRPVTASLNENKLSFSGNNKVYFDISNAEIYKYNYEKTINNIVSPVCQPLPYHC